MILGLEDARALRPEPPRDWGPWDKLRASRRALDNWLAVGLHSRWARLSDHLPALDQHVRESIWGREITVRPRAAPRMRIRRRDLGPLYDVFIRREYDFQVVDWAGLRTVVDCGANVGAFSAWVLGRSRAQVFAVEPTPSAARILGDLAARQAGRMRTMEVAVAARPGRKRFFESRGGTSSLVPWRTGWDPSVTECDVDVVTLAEVLALCGFARVDLLKIDIEGGEVGIFETAGAHVLRNVGAMLIEVHETLGAKVEPVVEAAREAGMRVAAESNDGTTILVAWRA